MDSADVKKLIELMEQFNKSLAELKEAVDKIAGATGSAYEYDAPRRFIQTRGK